MATGSGLEKLIVSAPFGNYLHFRGATRTLGTYTCGRRGTALARLWRALSTVRYGPRPGEWVNRLGLRNPGIGALPLVPPGTILSVHGASRREWRELRGVCNRLGAEYVELNLSCPNVPGSREVPDVRGFKAALIAKLGPLDYGPVGAHMVREGVRHFHLCNTYPSERGGTSGAPLKPHSLRAVRHFRREYGGDVVLIGGGGVTSTQDIDDYLEAGADHVAIGSMLFNPFKWYKVREFVRHLADG